MSSSASSPAPRPGDVAGTLRLLAYLAMSCALLVMDHRGSWLTEVRHQASVAVQPLWWLAGLPARLFSAFRAGVDTFHSMTFEEGAQDRERFQERMMQRFLTQAISAPQEDITYLLEKMDLLASESAALSLGAAASA